ncbi:MAG: PspC domain-containing protein [Clostridia bacterium]|nr:PspC domain-containing protein [Clostridia bacterium]MDD4386657.1 PspC domain-containing protein [Clostridia bacterium]
MSKRKLHKSRADKMIFGVCGGISESLHMDPSLVRLLWILFGCIFGSGVVTYIIVAMVLPYGNKEGK